MECFSCPCEGPPPVERLDVTPNAEDYTIDEVTDTTGMPAHTMPPPQPKAEPEEDDTEPPPLDGPEPRGKVGKAPDREVLHGIVPAARTSHLHRFITPFGTGGRRRQLDRTEQCLELVPGLQVSVTLFLTLVLCIYPWIRHSGAGIAICDESTELFFRRFNTDSDVVQGYLNTARWRFGVLGIGTFVCSLLVALAVEKQVSGSLHVQKVEHCLLLNWLCSGIFGMYRACDWCASPDGSVWKDWCVVWWVIARVLFTTATAWLASLLHARITALQDLWDVHQAAGYSRKLVRVCWAIAVASIVLAPVSYAVNHLADRRAADIALLVMCVAPVIIAQLACIVVALLLLRSLLAPLRSAKEVAAHQEVEEQDESRCLVRQARFELYSTGFCLITCIVSVIFAIKQVCDVQVRIKTYSPAVLLFMDILTPVHMLASGVALMTLGGILELPRCGRRRRHGHKHVTSVPCDVTLADWEEKVVDLCGRGFALEALLDFYQQLGESTMHHFDPATHTTADVVRLAIIPLTAKGAPFTENRPCSMASLMMQGKYTLADFVVTHNWQNRFEDLVSGIVAHALGMTSYRSLEPLMRTDMEFLKAKLKENGMLSSTWWVCAFSVNQHTTVCHTNEGMERDLITGLVHPVCLCNQVKLGPETNPPQCEVNKFPWLLRKCSQQSFGFTQVIVADRDFALFQRTWCAWEIAEGASVGIPQQLVVRETDDIEDNVGVLKDFRVQDTKASRPEDMQMLIEAIEDPNEFSVALRDLMFRSHDGILAEWEERSKQAVTLDAVIKAKSDSSLNTAGARGRWTM